MSSDNSTLYTRDVLVQMSDRQLDDAASKIKRLIRESEKRASTNRSRKDSQDDVKSLCTLEVEYCYVDDEKQRRQKFNENRAQRRTV